MSDPSKKQDQGNDCCRQKARDLAIFIPFINDVRDGFGEYSGDAEVAENLVSEQVLDAAIEVHRTLGGPGLLLTNLKLGLVINFGQGRLIDRWERVVNNL